MSTVGRALLGLALLSASPAAASEVGAVRLAGSVQPASKAFLARALAEAADRHAEAVILELDTPGGLVVSLREMTALVTGSPVPVVVHVTPAGARAASAGFFLLLAADVAAMAPGTNAGAAHPVSLGLGDEGRDQTMIRKATEDAAALARALAEQRGRPVEAARRAVEDARAYSAREARALGLVDLIVEDRAELLERLEGRVVRRWNGATVTLSTSGASVRVIEPNAWERLLMPIADPQIAFFLLVAGMLAIVLELSTPGGFVLGIAGAICLLLALYALSVLPVSVAGAALLLLGLGLLVAEAFVVSYGVLGAAGALAFFLGALMLFESPLPGAGLRLVVVAPSAALLAVASALLGWKAARMRQQRPRTGAEAMVGEPAEVTEPIAPEGRVLVHGESWRAHAPERVEKGERVRIVGVAGTLLEVERAPAAARGG